MLDFVRRPLYWVTSWSFLDGSYEHTTSEPLPVTTPSDKDPDQKALHYTENFRKAKRNALFWAAVTFLLSVGSVDQNKNVEISAIVRNLEFEQVPLIIGSIIVLLFMMFGYVRAEQRLIAQHTEFSFHRGLTRATDRIGEVTRAIENIDVQTNEYLREVEELVKVAKELKAGNDAFVTSFSSDLEKIDAGAEFREILRVRMSEGSSTRSIAEDQPKTIATKLNEELKNKISNILSLAKDAKESAEAKQSEALKNAVEGLSSRNGLKTEALETFTRDIKRFSNKIGGSEIIWFRSYDRLPVYAAFFVSMSAAIWKLICIWS